MFKIKYSEKNLTSLYIMFFPQPKSSSEQKASEYLKETLGDALTNILTECAEKRPDDPIAFIADGLERYTVVPTGL